MPSYTTNLRLVQPATGEYSGTWGTQVNNGITALVDAAVAGTASITMTAADYTLSNNNGAADEARAMFLVLGGSPGTARNVICPAVSKLYFVTNNTTGGFAQTVKTSAGTGISVPNGASMVLRCDGTNVVEALNALGSIVLNGGTANGVAYLNGSKVVTTGSALVFDGTNLGVGTSSPAEKLAVNQGNFYAIRTGGAKLRLADQNNEVSVESSPTGVASNMIFKTAATTQMTLDSSGNLGIGTSSPAATAGLTVSKASNAAVEAVVPSVAAIAVGYNNSGSQNAWGAPNGAAFLASPQSVPISFVTSALERMRIDATGKVAIGGVVARGDLEVGTSTATAITQSIHVGYAAVDYYGFRIANTNTASSTYAGKLIFQRGNGSAWVDAMTIGDGGDVFVATTSIPSSTNAGLMFALDANGTFLRNACTITATRTHFEFVNGNGTVGTIATNASATAYNTSSDRRLKTNIAPAADAGAVIDAIEVVQHDWKVGGHTRYGVIAQDLNAVAPEAVSAGDDGDEIEKTWGVDYSKLVPMLIKEIQTLRARVAALEAR